MSGATKRIAAMILSCVSFTLLQGIGSAKADEPDAQVYTKYGISISSIPIGAARVTTRFDDDTYKIVANGRTAGISRLVSDGRGTLITSGRIRRGRILPMSFTMDTVDDKITTHVRMGLTGQTISKLIAIPPLAKRADRIPVEQHHYKKIMDPLSAFLVPASGGEDAASADPCARTIPVFDGWQRFDVRLFFKEKRQVNLGGSDGYSGEVIVCKARYIPVAGHRPTRKTTVYLANNKNMEMWLAPVPGLPVFVPVHVKIGTRVGPLTLSAKTFDAKIKRHQRAQAN